LRGGRVLAVLAAQIFATLTLAACVTPRLSPLAGAQSLAHLPGWDAEDHAAAYQVVRQTCADAPPAGRSGVCADVASHPSLREAAARGFLETHFRVEPIEGEGLLTGYFMPDYPARHRPDAEFSAPVRPAPSDPSSALPRAEIDRLPAPDALAWMRPEDLFFMQVQGSGALTFEDGRSARAVFAGSNNQPFVAIARPMTAAGLVTAGHADAGTLHGWLAAHRGPEAAAVMDKDPRYIFFRLRRDDGGDPQGASGATLIPGRSLAIDPSIHPYLSLFWIDAGGPTLGGALSGYRRLAVAMDRGGAIGGPVRADLYTGRGARAGAEAATVRHTLRLYRIVPVGGR
jgi:membrane-bound lytic murein transglycosylase A